MGALTGTVDKTTQETIRKVLCMTPDCSKVYVSPNRLNLRFSVKKVKKDVQLKELKWIVNLIKEEGINCPKTIIFCNTMDEIAVVVNYLILERGRSVFCPEFSAVQDNCILGIYHSNSWQSTKDQVLSLLLPNILWFFVFPFQSLKFLCINHITLFCGYFCGCFPTYDK